MNPLEREPPRRSASSEVDSPPFQAHSRRRLPLRYAWLLLLVAVIGGGTGSLVALWLVGGASETRTRSSSETPATGAGQPGNKEAASVMVVSYRSGASG